MKVNDFRRGMLAKNIVDGNLMADPQLICHCGGEIGLNDHCQRCNKLAHVHEPDWRLRFNDRPVPERVLIPCRRCRDCNCLYFQSQGLCPSVGHNNWSRDLTWVTVRVGLVPSDALQNLATPGKGPLDLAMHMDDRAKARRIVEKWPDGPRKQVALDLLDGLELADVAAKVNVAVTSARFKYLIAQVVAGLHDFFQE
jgi:hypothetical protein